MKRQYLSLLALIVLVSTFAQAHDDHPAHTAIETGEAIVNAQIPCDVLLEEQLEAVGVYLTEEMHPGSDHETMQDNLGGEGSTKLKESHLATARAYYCQNQEDTIKESSQKSIQNTFYGNLVVTVFAAILFVGLIVFLLQLLSRPKQRGRKK